MQALSVCCACASRCDATAGHIDLLNVFRKPSDLPPHLDDILQAKPDVVWLQSGITNPSFEEALAKAGIKVVSDHCLMVEHRRAAASSKI
jgi:predicted CoA-binding protein